jgi:prevent-host-death family protein
VKTWQLQEAKARFSQLVKEAHKAPQSVTVHGKEEVVVLAKEEYEKLAGRPRTLLELFRDPRVVGADLVIKRNPEPSRPVDLRP